MDSNVEKKLSSTQELLTKGKIFLDSGKYKEAIDMFDGVLEELKDRETLEVLDVFKIDRETLRVLNIDNEVLSGSRKYKYLGALVLDTFVITLNFKGAALHKLGKYKEAIKVFDEALKLEPKDTGVLTNKGKALNELGKYDEALGILSGVLRIDSKNVVALKSIGYTLHKLNKHGGAYTAFDEALKLDPEDELTQHNRFLASWHMARSMLGFTKNRNSDEPETMKEMPKEP